LLLLPVATHILAIIYQTATVDMRNERFGVTTSLAASKQASKQFGGAFKKGYGSGSIKIASASIIITKGRKWNNLYKFRKDMHSSLHDVGTFLLAVVGFTGISALAWSH